MKEFHIKSPVLNFASHPWLYGVSVFLDDNQNFYVCPDFIYALFNVKENNSIRLHFQSTPCSKNGHEINIKFQDDEYLTWEILSEVPKKAEDFVVGTDIYMTLFRELHKLIETAENQEDEITGWLWVEIVE